MNKHTHQSNVETYIHRLKYAYSIACSDADEFRKLNASISRLQSDLFQHEVQGELLEVISSSLRSRLEDFDPLLSKELIEKPISRVLATPVGEYEVYMFSKQSVQWYLDCPIKNFDFILEHQLGLLDDARVVYDIGMHAGVWSMFYSLAVGKSGRIYSFEPSMLNIEQALASFFLNRIENITVFPLAVGNSLAKSSPDILVDFQAREMPQIPASYVFFDSPDFVKIDIEGYEHEVITGMPHLFDVCKKFHLEVHIPHLENRGIDFREITKLIPIDKFSIYVTSTLQEPGFRENLGDLKGFCSLFLQSY